MSKSIFALVGLSVLMLCACKEMPRPDANAQEMMKKTKEALAAQSSASQHLQQMVSASSTDEGCKMDAPCGASSSSAQ